MCDRNRTEILPGNTRKYITDIWARTHFVVIIFRIRYTKKIDCMSGLNVPYMQ